MPFLILFPTQNKELDKLPQTNNDVVLTYKEFKHLFPKSYPTIHFGHCEGFNELTSENISIIGTPITNPFLVFLYAKSLNLDYSTQKMKMTELNFLFSSI